MIGTFCSHEPMVGTLAWVARAVTIMCSHQSMMTLQIVVMKKINMVASMALMGILTIIMGAVIQSVDVVLVCVASSILDFNIRYLLHGAS